jgi:hypothetical protein
MQVKETITVVVYVHEKRSGGKERAMLLQREMGDEKKGQGRYRVATPVACQLFQKGKPRSLGEPVESGRIQAQLCVVLLG